MKKYIRGILAGMACAMLWSFPALADKLDSGKGVPTNLELDSSGEASWDNGDSEPVRKYDVKLYRLTNGDDWRQYKSRSTEEDSCEFTVSRTGYYKIQVRAHFYDDTYSEWSSLDACGETFIDEDDTSSGSSGVPDDWGWVYSPGPGYDQNGVPITPGTAKPIPNYSQNYGTSYPGYPNSNNYNQGQPAQTSNTGWVQGTHGWWYKYANGSYPPNCWQCNNIKMYFFDMNGYMQTGWVWWNNNWYLCLPDGQMATGWRNVNEKWYYLNESGVMLTGYQMIDGKMYYLDATGARVQNGYSPDGHRFDENGVMVA